jgi:uridine kinase
MPCELVTIFSNAWARRRKRSLQDPLPSHQDWRWHKWRHSSLRSAILARRKQLPPARGLVVGISGIDCSGKTFVARELAQSLGTVASISHFGRDKTERARPGMTDNGYNVAVIGADGWLNLPPVRFSPQNSAEHFYRHALRLDEMFEQLILPLRNNRSIDLEMQFTEETATEYRRHRYLYDNIDIIVVEGIFLFQMRYRRYFDLTCWIECSFETALGRAVKRRQEGLPPAKTRKAFSNIYFPAQRVHYRRDRPVTLADIILPNENRSQKGLPPESREAVTSILLSNSNQSRNR